MGQFSDIKTLIFDFGGVIINLDMQKCVESMRKLGFQNVDQYLGNFAQKDFFLDFEKGKIDTAQFRAELRKMFPVPVTDAQIDEAWCDFLQDIPMEKLELLEKLKKKYRLLMLSNTNPLHISTKAGAEFSKAGKTIYDYFDKCYFSYEMKMAKPDKEIFEALLKDAKIQPEECLFLDDGPKNIQVAAELGIQTYLVKEHENLDFLLHLDEDGID